MPRGVKKENLPSKVCEVCKRPFTWRKVWERCWEDLKTCSDRCKAERKKQNKAKKDDSNSVNTKETGPETNQMLKTDNGTALLNRVRIRFHGNKGWCSDPWLFLAAKCTVLSPYSNSLK